MPLDRNIKLHWVLLFLVFFLILLALQYDYLHLGFTISPTVTTILTVVVGLVITIFGRPENEKKKKGQVSASYTPLWIGFLIVLGSNILSLLTFGLGYYLFQDNLQKHGGSILLATYAIPTIFVLIVMFIRRRDSNSIFYVLRNFSKEAWIMVGIGTILVLLLYTYAQCQAFLMPWSVDCVLKTFGR